MPLVKATKQPLPYFEDSAQLFAQFASRPWAIFLDSAYPGSSQGRFDIMAYEPEATLRTWGNTTLIADAGGAMSGVPA